MSAYPAVTCVLTSLPPSATRGQVVLTVNNNNLANSVPELAVGNRRCRTLYYLLRVLLSATFLRFTATVIVIAAHCFFEMYYSRTITKEFVRKSILSFRWEYPFWGALNATSGFVKTSICMSVASSSIAYKPLKLFDKTQAKMYFWPT